MIKLDKEQIAALNQAYRKRLKDNFIKSFEKEGVAAEYDDSQTLLLTDRAGGTAGIRDDRDTLYVTTGEGRDFAYTFNEKAEPAVVRAPGGLTTGFDYDESGNLIAIYSDEDRHADKDRHTDRDRHVFEYDHNNYLAEITFPDKTCRRYIHTGDGNLEKSTDANGNDTCFSYNGAGQITQILTPGGDRTRFEYDEDGSPLSLIPADGNNYRIQYGTDNLVEKILVNGSPWADFEAEEETGSLTVRYRDGSFVRVKRPGRNIEEAENAQGLIALEYDDADRVVCETAGGSPTLFHRNEVGALTAIDAPGDRNRTFELDRDHRPVAVTDPLGNTVALSYHATGVLASITCPNGVTTTLANNAKGLPEQIEITCPDGLLHSASLAYDSRNRVVANAGQHVQTDYAYDPEGRLVAVSSTDDALCERFDLDPHGNIIRDSCDARSYQSGDRLHTAGNRTFSHDEHGRMVSDGVTTYEYDGRGQLVQAQTPRGEVRFRYDALGRRIEKKNGNLITRYTWAGQQILSEKTYDTGAGNQVVSRTEYTYIPLTPVPLSMNRDGNTYYFHTGHRAEVLMVTDASGRAVWQADYTAFGIPRIQVQTIAQPFRLAGQYHDPETGLNYSLARYYDPHTGRYLTRDPLFTAGGHSNFYIYCGGDPVNRVDPTGEFIFCAILVGAAIGAAIGAGVEAYSQHKAIQSGDQKDYNLWGIAKAGIVGGLIGAVGGGVGAAVGGAVAATSITGMAGAGFLEGVASSLAEQCAEACLTGAHIPLADAAKQALTDGVVGAAIGAVTMGVGGIFARKGRKAVTAATKASPPKTLARKAADKANAVKRKACKNMKPGKLKCNFLKAEPVNSITGEVVLEQEDFTIPGRIPLVWTRYYGSQDPCSGTCGNGWQTPADARLETDPQGHALFMDGTAGGLVFDRLPDPDGSDRNGGRDLVTDPVSGAVLSRGYDRYTVTLKSGISYHFAKQEKTGNAYPVFRITDPHYNHLEFVRKEGVLEKIRFSDGGEIRVQTIGTRIQALAYQAPASKSGRQLVRYAYDSQDNLIAAFDAYESPYKFGYANGRMIRHTDRNGHSFYYEYDGEDRCNHAYGDRGYYDYTFEYLDNETRFIDSLGHKGGITYNDAFLPIAETDHEGNTTRYEYDNAGRTISITDPLDRLTGYEYDEAGNVVRVIRPDNTSVLFEYENNRPVRIIDPKGHAWSQAWDGTGLLTCQTSPSGHETRYKYTKQGDLASIIDPGGNRTLFRSDPTGNTDRITDCAGNTTELRFDNQGNLVQVKNPQGQRTCYGYDRKSRLISRTLPSGAAMSCEYDAQDNLAAYTDENSHTTRFEYTVTDQVSKKIHPDGTSVSYDYDTEDRLTGITNELGEHYTLDRDHAGRITRETDYHGNTRRYLFNPMGRLYKSLDPSGRITEYEFDDLDRLIQKDFFTQDSPLVPHATETFAYDDAGNLIAHENNQARVTREFDNENRLIAETQGDFKVGYQYDALGNLICRTSGTGNTVGYEYDGLGNNTAVIINGQRSVNTRRNALGQPLKETFDGPMVREYQYNTDGLVTDQHLFVENRRVSQRAYAYDPAGNLVSLEDSNKGNSYFTYDPMNRITRHTRPDGEIETFLRNPAGDLGTHNAPDPETGTRTSNYRNTTRTFDCNGNLVRRMAPNDTTEFQWDENNRLTQATRNGQITRMAYDAVGRRLSKQTDNSVTRFFWEGDRLLADQKDGGGFREFIYYPGTFEPLAVIDESGKTFYFNNDVSGLPREVVTPDGELLWSADYDINGRVTRLDYADFDNPLRFQGQYFDPEVDLCYNRNRYYDPHTGAFISQDPIGLAAGENVYAYAPNVWGWVDPLGLAKCSNTPKKLAGKGEDLYVGTYSKSKYWNKKTGLNETHTPHHVVQDAVSDTTHGKGITINIRKDIHASLETTGRPKRQLDTLRQHLAADVNELRTVLREAGYDRSTVNRQLQELIRQNKATGGFSK